MEYRRAENLCAVEQNGHLLLVPLTDMTADLERVVRLDARGLEIWRGVGASFKDEEIARVLATPGIDPTIASADARAFAAELVRHGVWMCEEKTDDDDGHGVAETKVTRRVPNDETIETPRISTRGTPSRIRNGAVDFVSLIRQLLGSGYRVRFRARGRSMRPLVPDGSLLEVEASANRWRRGDVALYSIAEHGLVAHRVIQITPDGLITAGDSSVRRDRVPHADVLGRVTHRADSASGSSRVFLGSNFLRLFGLALGFVQRALLSLVGLMVIRPIQRSFRRRSLTRRFLAFALRVVSAILYRSERFAIRGRRRLDTWRAALTSSGEKDAERRRLYARHGVRDYTASQENLEAGLTLIEELLVRRRQRTPGTLLVLGCGPGRECAALADLGHTVTGVDFDPGMLEQARALAMRRGVEIEVAIGDATDVRLERRFHTVIAFSGLINMVLPRDRRLSFWRGVRDHLDADGEAWITFLSAYAPPSAPERSQNKSLLEVLNPEHRAGDRHLLNETIHLYPQASELKEEVEESGLVVAELFRDQRAYDRVNGQVKGYVIVKRPC